MDVHPLTETARLLVGARGGDPEFRAELLWRYHAPLRRLLHGRLAPLVPLETSDLVQSVFMSALAGLDRFEYSGVGSFWRYLRTVAINRAREENRRYIARPRSVQDSSVLGAAPDEEQDPAARMCEREASERFEAALLELDERVREAVLLRIELDVPYGNIAAECGFSSADAARMAIGRGLERLSRSLADWKET